jgi:WD40 repeat protein
MKKITLLIGVLFLLVGCKAPTEQVPILTGTFIPITPKLFITNTSLPRLTLTPQPTNTPTQATTSTLTPIPSPTADLVTAVKANQQPVLYASYPSPDGMWRVDIIIYDCVKVVEGGDENAYEQMILVDLASKEERVAGEQLQNCGGLGAYGFEGRYWSPNSRYFYYTDARQGLPDGCGYWDTPLSRFDVATMGHEPLGTGSLSPDGSKVATWNTTDDAVIIWDIDDGEITRFTPFKSAAGSGPLIWSPDSQSLVYIQVDSWCPVSGMSYLVQADLSDSGQSLLLESQNPTFADAEWDDTDVLSLFDQDGKAWRYNFITGELTLVP